MLDFMSYQETAVLLNVSTKTVKRWAYNHGLPVHAIGQARRISKKDLKTWLANKRRINGKPAKAA